MNPLLSMDFEPSLQELGDDYWDVVDAAKFPLTQLRFRNDYLLKYLGLKPEAVEDRHFEEAYGRFLGRYPLLALRYHGYQFGIYNPYLGDGRGFLYGQLRDVQGQLQDLGTKGSGITPWSRGGDGRLTLKGGVREIIASEALHRLGVTTSRTLSLVETGEDLWRGDEPSPTRSSVMVRMARTHLRFGSCERLLYLHDPKGLERLLLYVVRSYYPAISAAYPIEGGHSRTSIEVQLLHFYAELVVRVARLSGEWMAAGFTHGVLNTDNMSLVGESFDYGPFAFLDRWDPGFIAAYFDQTGLYAFERQPEVCYQNLRLLQEPLAMLLAREKMEEKLDRFTSVFQKHYRFCLERRLGFPVTSQSLMNVAMKYDNVVDDLVKATLSLLNSWKIEYGKFFAGLSDQIFKYGFPIEPDHLQPMSLEVIAPPREAWLSWRDSWWLRQNSIMSADSNDEKGLVMRLQRWNLPEPPTRQLIENLWNPIAQRDDWGALNAWLKKTSID